MTAADLHIAHFHHGILRMELPVAAFEGLGHTLDRVHDVQAAHQVHIHAAGVAHQSQDRIGLALGHVDLQSQILQPVDQLLLSVGRCSVLQYNDHDSFLL